MRAARLSVTLVVCFVTSTLYASPKYQEVLIRNVPHVRQKPDFCGEACAEMAFRKLGHPITQDQVFDASGLDPALGRGCYTAELNTALGHLGIRTGNVWYRVDAARSAAQIEEQWRALHADLLRGVPSIVCMHYSDRPDTTEHFRLVLGYRAKSDEVVFNEPAEDHGAYCKMPRHQFLKLWPLNRGTKDEAVIRLRLEPGRIVEPAAVKGFDRADYAQHIMEVKKKLASRRDFTILVQEPFVVIGDEDAAMVRRRATDTVKFAVDRLKRDFFTKDPNEILDIWLFKDKSSYEQHVEELFGSKPTTPFGYFSSANKALIMNIETGGGTLVHEIVHPFIAANFPDCPPWFNEGLGSLYEQCEDRGGHLHGLTNWRLAGLQEIIRKGEVPSFAALTSMDSEAFYEKDRGANYSQSRYLLYYLQERGLLVKFYRKFLADREKDPTGYKTLRAVLGEDDMDGFKEKWEKYVLKLSFP
ncbi:MAG TPA: C39 family peptidase [Phycisphaerae bacterium]|nr:C39 family peptidase [Phycisphaerae bacterium]